jgi:hypothetical protein
MFLSYWTLAVALSLSIVAAWYSIIGLTAIFAAATIPIVIMGGIMEVAKVTVTLWLHEYWQFCKRSMKVQLTASVVLLMFITSMGIFGFLSKAHLDQAVPTGDVAAKVQILDEKIKTERDIIDANRKALAQMDSVVDQTMARSTTEEGATKSANLRRSQARERNTLQTEISQSQKKIAALNEERAPIASELRKVEAEVGPIKYIAALIYGDNPDANLLEKAVRWVIILLVIVFDPLAIMMVLAATESIKWERQGKRNPETDTNDQTVINWFAHVRNRARFWDKKKVLQEETNNATVDDTNVTDPVDHNSINDSNRPVEPFPEPDQPVLDTGAGPDGNAGMGKDDESVNLVVEESNISAEDIHEDHVTKQAMQLWKQDHPGETLKEQRRLLSVGHIDHLPWEDYLEDPRIVRDASFGKTLPESGVKGDMFILVDSLPTRLFKYNGEKWIEVDKNVSDSYAYNQAYIDLLIEKIGAGQYDPELLTDAEREQIEDRIRRGV